MVIDLKNGITQTKERQRSSWNIHRQPTCSSRQSSSPNKRSRLCEKVDRRVRVDRQAPWCSEGLATLWQARLRSCLREKVAPPRLCQDGFDDFAGDVGEAVVAALESECQPFVIESELVQDRCLEVVDMHGVFSDAESEFV